MRSFRWALATACIVGLASLADSASAITYTSFSDWATAVGSHTTIDFEDLAPNTVVSNQYAGLSPAGVVFSTPATLLDIADSSDVASQVGGVPVSGDQVLDVSSASTDPITGSFVQTGTGIGTTVNAAGGWMIDLASFDGGTVDFLDASGGILESLTFTPTAEENVFFGAVNFAGIAAVTFDGVSAGEFVLIDDFVFSNVPEPSAIVLGLSSVLVLLTRRPTQ